MTRSARAREVRALRRLPRWLRVRGLAVGTRGVLTRPTSGGTTFDSDRFRGRVNASLELVADAMLTGELRDAFSRWS